MKKEDWKTLMQGLTQYLSPTLLDLLKLDEEKINKLRDLLIARIASLNKLSFRSRLTQLFDGIPKPYLMPLIGNPNRPDDAIESFLKKIEATRNFLTHHEQAQSKNSLYEQDLRDAMVSCWAVLTFWIARKLGFSEKESGHIASRASRTMFLVSKKSEL